jgi:hypothetical protein
MATTAGALATTGEPFDSARLYSPVAWVAPLPRLEPTEPLLLGAEGRLGATACATACGLEAL